MYTDPAVVRRKVERELKDFVARIDHYRSRGIWILEYRFPELLVAFATPNIKPYALVPYAVLMDLSNYDVEPPSLRFVNPFTREPLRRREIPTNLQRLKLPGNPLQFPAIMFNPQQPGAMLALAPGVLSQDLLQAWTPEDDEPFVCLQGVREYHDNPGHTGDPWWLHRGKGMGGICRLLDLLSKYGTEAMREPAYQMKFEAQGFVHQIPTEPI